MKPSPIRLLALVSCLFAAGAVQTVMANEGCDEKAEMKRQAEQYRSCARENKAAALGECEASAPASVKAAALKVVEARHRVGEIEEKMAAACEAGDRKLFDELYGQKQAEELECEYSEREKRAAWAISSVDELLQCHPDSAEAKQLKEKTVAQMAAYLSNARQLIDLQKQQIQIEKKFDGMERSIEIIRKREELKRLEAEE